MAVKSLWVTAIAAIVLAPLHTKNPSIHTFSDSGIPTSHPFSPLVLDVRQPKAIQVVPDVDAVVVAGDVCEGAERGFVWLRQIVPMQIPIIAVMGNHEFYRRGLAR